MKLSTLTTDFQIVLDYLEENNESLYNEILSQLENNGTDKDSIRLVTIIRMILDYFPKDKEFQALFDYAPEELIGILNAIISNKESYKQIWDKLIEITDLSSYEYYFPEVNVDTENYSNEFVTSEKDDTPTAVWIDGPGEETVSYELCDLWDNNLDFWHEDSILDEVFGSLVIGGDIYSWDDLTEYQKEKVWEYLNNNPDITDNLANKGNVVTQQQAMQQQIKEDEDEVVETKKNYTDAQIAKSMNITLDQLFTLRTLKDNTPITFKTKYKVKDRKTKKITESNKGMFWHFSELFNKGYVGVRMPDGGGTSMKAKEFFNKTSVRTLKYEGPTTDLSTVEPTEADLNKIKKFGKYSYEYTPGGYPSSALYKFDNLLRDKLDKAVDAIKTREIVIRMSKAYIQVYAQFNVVFERKCMELGCTEIELETLRNYSPRWEERTISYRI